MKLTKLTAIMLALVFALFITGISYAGTLSAFIDKKGNMLAP